MKRPLFWHQGLFLQPQHFQLKDRYDQSLLIPFHRFINPHFWGIGDKEIQQAALGKGSFDVLSGNFLFPDMTFAGFPDNALIEARSFEGAWGKGGKTFTVYIGLKKWNDAGENVTVVSGFNNLFDVTTRFVTTNQPEEIQDLHQNGPSAQVRRLYYVLKIFWETEMDLLGDYELIPIACLEKDGDEIVLSKQFVPPCLCMSGSETLNKIVLEIKDQISSRGRQLETYKRDRGIHSAEFGTRDMVFLLALRSLNRYIPLLTHLTETKRIHPWSMYSVLRQVIGELSTFSGNISVNGEEDHGALLLPGYDHQNLWECFSGAKLLITRLLDEITAGPEYIIQLLYDGTYFSAELPPTIFEGRNQFFLVFETETDPKKVLQTMENIAKLSSRQTLPILIARSLSGIKLDHLATPPQELPRRAHSIYFQIDHHGDQWDQVKKGNNLALYWDAAPQDLKAELMTVRRT